MENKEEPVYELKYQLTEEDYLEYNLCHIFNIPENRKYYVTRSYLYAAIYFILGVLGAYLTEYWMLFVICTIIAILYATAIRIRIEKSIRSSIRLMGKTGKLPFETDTLIQFYENELVDKSEQNTEVTNYSAIERVIVGKNAMYLYRNALRAYILPNRAFIDVKPEVFLQWILTKTKVILITDVTE